MYPLVHLSKRRPSGGIYVHWCCYRLPDRDGFVRLFTPSRTRRVYPTGFWAPDGMAIVAIDSTRPYVLQCWRSEQRSGLYVDAARSVTVEQDRVSYVDLYLDLAFEAGVWHLLDEDELSAATEDDSRLARSSIELVRRLIETDARILDPTDAIWDVPADALGLEPRDDCLQEPFNENDALPRS